MPTTTRPGTTRLDGPLNEQRLGHPEVSLVKIFEAHYLVAGNLGTPGRGLAASRDVGWKGAILRAGSVTVILKASDEPQSVRWTVVASTGDCP